MKKIHFILMFLIIFTTSWSAYSQSFDPNIKLPLDQKLALYFNTFRDLPGAQGASIFADYIVGEFNIAVIPYLKEYIKDVDYFDFVTEPQDITLDLIAYVISALNLYTNPIFKDIIEPYVMDRNEIQWFVDQYKYRLDEYIRVTKEIDDVVTRGEGHILRICDDKIEEYGHPDFLHGNDHFQVDEIKKYYEERLGIPNLRVTNFPLPIKLN